MSDQEYQELTYIDKIYKVTSPNRHSHHCPVLNYGTHGGTHLIVVKLIILSSRYVDLVKGGEMTTEDDDYM